MIPLIEKYRPKNFEEIVGVKDLATLKHLISTPKEMPNLLFYGPQGTGKTSMAKIIIDTLSPIDVKKINGSDTTGVDTIREAVYNFITSMSSQPDKPKIIWIEEFDFMSDSAYAALRSMMETYMKNARFICTCNYIKKIPEPIQSRFQAFEFIQTDYQWIEARLTYICEQEGIAIKDGFSAHPNLFIDIINKHKGDIRSCINEIQMLSANPSKTINYDDIKDSKTLAQDVCNYILEKKWTDLRYEVPKHRPDYKKLLVEINDIFIDSEIEAIQKANVNEIIAHGLFEMAFSFDLDIAFAAVCSRLMKIL